MTLLKRRSFTNSRTQQRKSFVEKIKRQNLNLIYLIHSKVNNISAWHYLEVKKEKLPIFLKNANNNAPNLDLPLYGNILFSGWGDSPPDSIIQRINTDYGK